MFQKFPNSRLTADIPAKQMIMRRQLEIMKLRRVSEGGSLTPSPAPIRPSVPVTHSPVRSSMLMTPRMLCSSANSPRKRNGSRKSRKTGRRRCAEVATKPSTT